MSLYWYLVCDDCKTRAFAGESHARSSINLDDKVGDFLMKHAGHRIRAVVDPDAETDPEVVLEYKDD